MIKQWKLSAFKSIKGPTSLEFAPLTVIAGANSSGKSSLLQSILLVAQTLSSQNSVPSVRLNGKYFRFGYFEDIVHAYQESNSVEIGWTCLVPASELLSVKSPHSEDKVGEFGIVEGTVIFSSDSESGDQTLNPLLSSSTLKFQPDLSKDSIFTARVHRRVNTLTVGGLDYDSLDAKFSKFSEFDIAFEGLQAEMANSVYGSEAVVGCFTKDFLPDKLVVSYDPVVMYANSTVTILAAICKDPNLSLELSGEIFLEDTLVGKLATLTERSKDFANITALFKKMPRPKTSELAIVFRKWTVPQRKKFVKFLFEVQEEVVEALSNALGASTSLRTKSIPPPVEQAIEVTKKFFVESVKYLGPLRDEPRSFYSSFGGDSDTLGLKGELTALVMHQHLNDVVDNIAEFPTPPSFDRSRTQCTLAEMMNVWLDYLGVADDVTTKDEGKLGHRVQVNSFDLTHVGFGVSQVLPIVALGLLSKPGETLLIEQPELHLHPYVQSRLADFFVSLALANRQVVVESHSEYIVNKLRVAIAESDSNKVSNAIKIYFALKVDGVTDFQNVQINKYGTIANWPVGFFDESQSNAERLIAAALRKRDSQHD